MEIGSGSQKRLSQAAQEINSDISQNRFGIEQPIEEQFSTNIGCAMTREKQALACYNLNRKSHLAGHVDHAVQKNIDGTYGICEDCKNQIPLERLKEIPTAKRCVQCQTIREG